MAFPRIGRLKSLGVLGPGAPPLAIDFGLSSLKVLHVGPGDPPQLQGAAELPTPEELRSDPAKVLAFQLESLPALVRSGGFRMRRAACAIPAGHTICKHLRLPKGDAASLGEGARQALALELGCDPASLICQHIEVPGASDNGAPGKAEVIALAVPRALVTRLMGAITSSRLEPVGMQPECLALVRAFDHINRRAEDAKLGSLYLDLGAGSTKVCIAHGTELVFVKTIQLGGRFLDQVAARQLRATPAEARAQRLSATDLVPHRELEAVAGTPGEPAGLPAGGAATATLGAPAGVAVAAPERRLDLREPLDTLTDELAVCLRYHALLFPSVRVGRVIFVGGEARHRALCQHIARLLRIPASVADPLARLARTSGVPAHGVDLGAPQPGWAVPVGLSFCPTET